LPSPEAQKTGSFQAEKTEQLTSSLKKVKKSSQFPEDPSSVSQTKLLGKPELRWPPKKNPRING